jgi:hypothetical protein
MGGGERLPPFDSHRPRKNSWGAVYFAAPWRRFLRVAKALTALPALPSVSCPAGMGFAEGCSHVAVNRWGRSSWKRLLVLHMLSEGALYTHTSTRTCTRVTPNPNVPHLEAAARAAHAL